MKLINKVLIIALTLMVTGCSVDDGDSYSYEMLPIESIDLPNEFILNETYDIDFTFIRPTNCHGYHGIFINSEEENRIVGVTSIIYDNSNCMELTADNIASQSFRFQVLYDQIYVFHIWKGVDEFGDDIFETIEVPVVN